MTLCGGLTGAQNATDEIQALIDEVRADLEAKEGKSFPLYKAVAYKSQLVAGTNYFIKIQTNEDEYIHARVFKDLPCNGGSVTLHSHQSGKTKEDAIDYS